MTATPGRVGRVAWKTLLAAAGAVLAISASAAWAGQVGTKYYTNSLPLSPSEAAKAKPMELPRPSRSQMQAAGVLKADGSVTVPAGNFSRPLSATARILSAGSAGEDAASATAPLFSPSGNTAAKLDLKSLMSIDTGSVAPLNYGSTEFPFSASRVELAGKLSSSKTYPYRASGRLEVRFADGSVGLCSATLIRKGVLVTAAHCLADFGYGFNSIGATFYAGYFNGKKPYGAAYGMAPFVLPSYLDGTDTCAVTGLVCLNDVALIVLYPKGSKYVGSRTGWLNVGVDGYGYTSVSETHITQLGYPVGIDSATQMIRNDSQGVIADASLAFNTIIGTPLDQGSSGGPWVENFGTPGVLTGAFPGYASDPNVIVGVTSWGFPAGTELVAGASFFTSSNIGTLLDAACTAYPLACAP